MSPEEQLLLIIVTVSLLTGVILYRTIDAAVRLFLWHRAYNNGPRGIPINELESCPDRHEWYNVKLAVRQVPYGAYDVCLKCGVISGTEFQLNKPGLSMIKEAKVLLAKQRDYEKQIALRLEFDLEHRRDRWIEGNIQNLIRIAKDGRVDSLVENLKYFFKYTLESQQEIIEKIKHEEDGQRDLDARYEKWSKR